MYISCSWQTVKKGIPVDARIPIARNMVIFKYNSIRTTIIWIDFEWIFRFNFVYLKNV